MIREAKRILAEKFGVPDDAIAQLEAELRIYPVEPMPSAPAPIPVADPDDGWVLASALAAGVNALVTGDRHLLTLRDQVSDLRIVTPRELWDEIDLGSR